MALLQDIIMNNDWATIKEGAYTEVNRVVTANGIISNEEGDSPAFPNSVSKDNVMEKVQHAFVSRTFDEGFTPVIGGGTATSTYAEYDHYTVKTQLKNRWFGIHSLEKKILSGANPQMVLANEMGRHWVTLFNRYLVSTLQGMRDIAEITFGSDVENFSRALVDTAGDMRGDQKPLKSGAFYMSSRTFADIRDKQQAGVITEKLLLPVYGPVTLSPDGVSQAVTTDLPSYKYDGIVDIVFDDTIEDGMIAILDRGAFGFTQHKFTEPIKYQNSPKEDMGGGIEEWGLESLFIIHPRGFNFTGVRGTHYASRFGCTLAELQAGGMYTLKVDKKLSPITLLKVKIGA